MSRFHLALALLFLLGVPPAALHAGIAPSGTGRILYIDSNSSADLWANDLREAFQRLLNETVRVRCEIFELGVRFRPGNLPSPSDLKALQANLDMRSYNLVVAANDTAAGLFIERRLTVPAGTPLLLLNYSGAVSPQLQRELGMTAVQSDYRPARNAGLCQRLLPEVRHFALLVEPHTPPELIDATAAEWEGCLTVIDGADFSTGEMLRKVAELPPGTMLQMDSWSSTKEDMVEVSYTILPRIREVFRGPIFGRFAHYIDYGSCGGYVIDAESMGRTAGAIALRLLRGEPAADIAPAVTETRLVLDYPSLAEAGVPMARIPREAELVHLPPDFLTEYRLELILAMAALIGALLVFCGRLFYRRQALKKIAVLLNELPLLVGIVDRSGRILQLHAPDDAEISGKVTCLDDLEGAMGAQIREAVRNAFDSGRKQTLDYRNAAGCFRQAEFHRLPPDNPYRGEVVMWISKDQTELRQAYLKTKELEEHRRLTLNSIGDGVIATDAEERVTFINPAAVRLTGYDREEAAGRKLDEVFDIVSYLDGRKVESPLRQALTTGTTVELANHTDLIARDGSRRHIADCASPIFDADHRVVGGVLVFRDVTEDYRNRDRLRMHSSILQSVKNIAQFDYFHCDGAGKIHQPASEQYWPLKDGSPVPIDEWIVPEDREGFLSKWKRMLADELGELHIIYSAGPERRHYEMWAAKSINPVSRRYEYVGIIQDVTHIRREERRYRDNFLLLESIVEDMPGYLFVKDVEDGFRYILGNRKFGELASVDWKSVAGKFDREIFPLDERAAAKFRQDDERLATDGGLLELREFFTDSRGERIAAQTVKKVIRRADGSRLLIGMGVDITRQDKLETERRELTENLKRYIEQERFLNSVWEKISFRDDDGNVIREIMKTFVGQLSAHTCYIYHTDFGQGKDIPFAQYYSDPYTVAPPVEQHPRLPIESDAVWFKQILARQIFEVPDTASEEAKAIQGQWNAYMPQLGIRSICGTGIWVNGEYWGYLGFTFQQPHPKLSTWERFLLASAAHLSEIFLERSISRAELERSEYQKRLIIDTIKIPVLLFDAGMKLVRVNNAALEIAGVPEEEVYRKPCFECFCGRRDVGATCPVFMTGQDCRPHSCSFTIRGRDYIADANPILENGKLMNILTTLVDVTETNRAERHLKAALEQARAADRAKSYFLATVSHELRTPLNAVIGFSELLQNVELPREEQQDYLQSVNCAGTVLLNLINDVLDLSKLEADQVTITPALVDLKLLFEEIASVFRLKAKEKGIGLRVSCGLLPGCLYLDNLRMRQVLLNLVGNAVKFTRRGEITIEAEFLPSGPEAGELVIRVADTGIGISPEFARKIFEPFAQEENTRGNRVYEGSGLGLAICKRLVQKMDGVIELASRKDCGSTFTIRLQNIRCDAVPRPPGGAAPPGRPGLRRTARILLVDDVPMNLKVLQAMLRKLGAESVCAGSAREALELLRQDGSFDLLLTDVWMPAMSGIDLAREIHDDERLTGLPVIAVTADTQIMGDSSGAFHDVLLKPFTLESLCSLIRKHFTGAAS